MAEKTNKQILSETHDAVIKVVETVCNLSNEVRETKLEVKSFRTDMNLQAKELAKAQTALFGIPNTNSKGLSGRVSHIENRIEKVESRQVKIFIGLTGIAGAVGGGVSKLISWLSS